MMPACRQTGNPQVDKIIFIIVSVSITWGVHDLIIIDTKLINTYLYSKSTYRNQKQPNHLESLT